jgi:hypothetical protein
MKKATGNVFRPWDDASGGGVSPVLVKTELPTLKDEQETLKKDEHEEGEDLTSGPNRDRESLGLESGLAIAMRGLVGSAGRWNLGGCLRGLMLRPPLSGPVTTGPQPRPPLRGQPTGGQPRPTLLPPSHPDSRSVSEYVVAFFPLTPYNAAKKV